MKPTTAIALLLRPIIRFALFHGLRFQDVSEILKQEMVTVAATDFAMDERKITDSRISLLTGLQRRDVARFHRCDTTPNPGFTPIARVLNDWPGTGSALTPLSQTECDGLIRTVSKDVHPRTLRDEMLRLGVLIQIGRTFVPQSRHYVPAGDDAQMIAYFAANCADHLDASVGNLKTRAGNLDRAAHFDHLSETAIADLHSLARRVAETALTQVADAATEAQKNQPGRHRFRFGTYFFAKET